MAYFGRLAGGPAPIAEDGRMLPLPSARPFGMGPESQGSGMGGGMGSPIVAGDDDLNRLGTMIGGAQRPSFFGEGGTGRTIAGTLGDVLLRMSGQAPAYAPAMQHRQDQLQAAVRQRMEQTRQDERRMQDRQWAVEDRDAQINAPQFFNAGRDRVRLDPLTGQSTVVYDAPEDYEAYAGSLGLNPGDEGYESAVQDYVLRGNGPTALQARTSLENTRQANRVNLRQVPTFAQRHPRAGGMMFNRRDGGPRSPSAVIGPILGRVAAGQPITPAQQAALDYYKRPAGRGGGGGGAAPRISSQADYAKLPKGASYIAPDGSRRVKP